MTSMTTLELESYFEGVYAALADLPTEIRDELLEELPDHLAEVAAEEGGSMIDRLGRPEDYAAELRAAAGYEVRTPDSERNLLAERWIQVRHRLREIDQHGARFLGYERVTDLLRALRPGWWVLRGWLVAELVCGTHDRATWHGFIPAASGDALVGFLILVIAIVASLWVGTRSAFWSVWPRRITAIISIALAFWGIAVLARNIGGTLYAYSYDNSGYSSPLDQVQDVYVYDQNGKPVSNARLYDQNGQPIQIGSGYCPDGTPGPYVNDETDGWTYPICPSATSPFRAGPGAVSGVPLATSVPPSSTPAASTPAASAPATSAPATSAPAKPKPSAKASATKTR